MGSSPNDASHFARCNTVKRRVDLYAVIYLQFTLQSRHYIEASYADLPSRFPGRAVSSRSVGMEANFSFFIIDDLILGALTYRAFPLVRKCSPHTSASRQ